HVTLTAPLWSGGVRFQGYEASPSAEALADKPFEVLPAMPTEDDFVALAPRSQIQFEARFDLPLDLDQAVVAVETPVAEIHLLAPLSGGEFMAPQDRCSDDWLLAG
uniref:hypothetical protein n=1 Tax=Brevundimonas sp. TaxID=1871086 RepID=UPI00289F328D